MPTVLRRGNLRFVIYPNDHEPAHVHVLQGTGRPLELKINLGELDGCPSIIEADEDFPDKDIRRALEVIMDNIKTLRSEWNRIHG